MGLADESLAEFFDPLISQVGGDPLLGKTDVVNPAQSDEITDVVGHRVREALFSEKNWRHRDAAA